MIELIETCLGQNGYQRISTNVQEVKIYYLPEGKEAFVVLLFMDNDGDCFSTEQYDTILNQVRSNFLQHGFSQIEQLNIIVTEATERIRENYHAKESYWIAVPSEKRLIVYEDQEFGLRGETLRKAIEGSVIPMQRESNRTVKKKSSDLPFCTIILIAVNVIVFLLVEATGSSDDTSHMLEWGAMYGAGILEKKEYFRFISSMFLHFGFNHLANNMFILAFMGNMVEKILGKAKYLFLYFTTGILAGVVSMVYHMMQNEQVLSAGASGAIFGIVGAMVTIALVNKGKQEELSTRQLLLFVAVSFYAGIYDGGNVDIAAHVGGFISGILLAALLYRRGTDYAKRRRINK